MSRKREEDPRKAAETWLERLSPWEGPDDTLFLYSAEEGLWYVLGLDGSEARVSARDLRLFVDRCLAARESGGPAG